MAQYENDMQYAAKEAAAGQFVGSVDVGPRTLGENIANKIASHERSIERLKRVQEVLKTGSILDANINDLQEAMRW